MVNRLLSEKAEAHIVVDQPLDDVVAAFVSLHRSGNPFSLPAANDPEYGSTIRNLHAIASRIRAQRRARTRDASEPTIDLMHMTSAEALAYARGRSDERAAVVAWLQAEGDRLEFGQSVQ